jgi:NAD(P)H-dependent FMN reductase
VTRIGIILGSTRPNRNGEQVARWVLEVASRRRDARFEFLDLRDYPLPHLDEPPPPSFGQYQGDHTKRWAAKTPRSTASSSSPPSTTTAPPVW